MKDDLVESISLIGWGTLGTTLKIVLSRRLNVHVSVTKKQKLEYHKNISKILV